jgi:hypothetical protein
VIAANVTRMQKDAPGWLPVLDEVEQDRRKSQWRLYWRHKRE